MTSSIGHRFAFTLGANLSRSAVGVITAMLLARWLGPENYGRLAFLLGTFLALRALLDLGTSSAFFTFLSQRGRSRKFVAGYFAWMGIQLFVSLLVISLLFPPKWVSAIWKGEPLALVIPALIAAFMQSGIWVAVSQAAESQRRTVWVQAVGVGVAVVHFAAVVTLWSLGRLGILTVLVALVIEYAIAAWLVHRRFVHELSETNAAVQPREIFKKYVDFCLPMAPYVLAGFLADFADRWILQHYGGSAEQAYYAVGLQLSAIALIATTSMLRVFWKEIAEANHLGDVVKMERLYRRVCRLLFFVGALLAGFLIPWTHELLSLILGSAYTDGAATLAVMLLYPIHQSLGQITGTFLYATERVLIQVIVGSTTMLVGIVVTYLTLAPATAPLPGLGLGSEGLAWKMVLIQFINVNIIMFIIARIWRWSFDWTYQPVVLLTCFSSGWFTYGIVTTLGGGRIPAVLEIAMASIIYLLLMASIAMLQPHILLGMTRDEVLSSLRAVRASVGAVLRRR